MTMLVTVCRRCGRRHEPKCKDRNLPPVKTEAVGEVKA